MESSRLTERLVTRAVTRRREFIKILTSAGLAAQLASMAHAAEKIDPSDPYAKTAGYVTNAAQVDTTRFPHFEKGQRCDNCKLFTATEDGWGECSFFDGAAVIGTGWCKSYKPRK